MALPEHWTAVENYKIMNDREGSLCYKTCRRHSHALYYTISVVPCLPAYRKTRSADTTVDSYGLYKMLQLHSKYWYITLEIPTCAYKANNVDTIQTPPSCFRTEARARNQNFLTILSQITLNVDCYLRCFRICDEHMLIVMLRTLPLCSVRRSRQPLAMDLTHLAVTEWQSSTLIF